MKFLFILVLTPTVFGWGAETNKVSDKELQAFTEELLKKDVNNAAQDVRINDQGHKKCSRKPLLDINSQVFSIPTISKLRLLYDNDICYAGVNERAKNNLLDSFMDTRVMQLTMNFLAKKGFIDRDPNALRDLLKQIWFRMYPREDGTIISCGFKHVFLGELTERKVSGMHNWVFFDNEEKRFKAYCFGYIKGLQLGRKGAILKLRYKWANVIKPVGSMFVGTSPELEMALYTVCFLVHPDEECQVRMAGKDFSIRTYTYRYQNKNMIGSAFPEI